MATAVVAAAREELLAVPDRRYWAGLFDGEGCINIHAANACRLRRGWSPTYRVQMQLVNTYVPVIEQFRERFGECLCSRQPPGCKRAFLLTLTGAQALSAIQTLYPFLQIKRQIGRAHV